MSEKGLLIRVAAMMLLLVAGSLLATRYLARSWVLVGSSMSPTLAQGDRLVVDLWTYRRRSPRAGELVLCRGPHPRTVPLVKRAAPLPPGVGNPEVDDPIWLLGDNPRDSLDSRQLGPVPARDCFGRVVGRYWPPERAGSVP